MTIYDLRDRTPHYGQVAMGPEDRTALSIAADRERARIFRRRWYETWVGKVVALATVIAAGVEVIQAFHR